MATLASHESVKGAMRKGVWIVCGPGHSGKSTFVQNLLCTSHETDTAIVSSFHEAPPGISHLIVDLPLPMRSAEWESLALSLTQIRRGEHPSLSSVVFVVLNTKSLPVRARATVDGVVMMRNNWSELTKDVHKWCRTGQWPKYEDWVEEIVGTAAFTAVLTDLNTMTGDDINMSFVAPVSSHS